MNENTNPTGAGWTSGSSAPPAPPPAPSAPPPSWVKDTGAWDEAQRIQSAPVLAGEEGHHAYHERLAAALRRAAGETPEAPQATSSPEDLVPRHAEAFRDPFPGEAASPELAALGKEARSLAFTLGVQDRETLAVWIGQFEAGLARQERISDLEAEQERARCERELRSRWGEGYEANVQLLREVLGHYPKLRDAINESGLGRNAEFLQELFTYAFRERTQRESEAIFKKHGHALAADVARAEGA
jgi:hypothetical protein